MQEDRLISPQTDPVEESQERAIRPLSLSEYVGQEEVKQQMDIFINAARNRNEPLDHTLVFGPPGLGKTTLANIVAHELDVAIRTTSGPVLEKAGDLAAMLTNLGEGDVIRYESNNNSIDQSIRNSNNTTSNNNFTYFTQLGSYY